MKKLLILLMVLCLLGSLTACELGTLVGGGSTEATGDSLPVIDFKAILSGKGDTSTIWSKASEKAKQALMDAAAKEGLEVTFGDDDTMTIHDPESGTTVQQKADGNWVFKSEDGEVQLGGQWPDNEFTRALPKPDFKLTATVTDGKSFSVGFLGVKLEDVKAYAQKVKDAGFFIGPEVTENEVMGLTVYSYEAYNADGWKVTVSFAVAASGIVVEKPE